MTSDQNYTPEADRLSLLFADGRYTAAEQVTLWAGNFRRLERELREEIEALHMEVGRESFEELAYMHLRDSANREEIEFVLLSGMAPHVIDARMKGLMKDIYPDPGFSQP